MSISTVLPEMLARRRDRAISIVLNLKERECDSYLPKEASSCLRKVVLDQMNDLVDFAIDVCNSLDTGDVVLNEFYLQLLSELHDAVVEPVMARAFYDLGINDRLQNIVEMISNSSAEMIDKSGSGLRNFISFYEREIENKANIAKINKGIAAVAREAVVDAYQANVLDVRAAPSYRAGDHGRIGGGRLLRALKSNSMAIGDEEGISFINTALLDESAAQWARLNFGAEPNIGFSHGALAARSGRIRFGSGQGISLRLVEGPGAPFGVPNVSSGGGQPHGYFNGSGQLMIGYRDPASRKTLRAKGGDGEIFLKGQQSQVGIGARRFLDAGLVALGNEFGPAYRDFFRQAEITAREKAKQAAREIGSPFYTREANLQAQGFRTVHEYAKFKGWR